jgi:hypothetical protein
MYGNLLLLLVTRQFLVTILYFVTVVLTYLLNKDSLLDFVWVTWILSE